MSVTQYIGARYVPLFVGNWDINAEYEPLSIVYYMGNSYTSRQAVPSGVPIENEEYWALTGNYNAQVEQYRQEVRTFDGRITANANAIADHTEAIENNADDIAQNASDIRNLTPRVATNETDISAIKTELGGLLDYNVVDSAQLGVNMRFAGAYEYNTNPYGSTDPTQTPVADYINGACVLGDILYIWSDPNNFNYNGVISRFDLAQNKFLGRTTTTVSTHPAAMSAYDGKIYLCGSKVTNGDAYLFVFNTSGGLVQEVPLGERLYAVAKTVNPTPEKGMFVGFSRSRNKLVHFNIVNNAVSVVAEYDCSIPKTTNGMTLARNDTLLCVNTISNTSVICIDMQGKTIGECSISVQSSPCELEDSFWYNDQYYLVFSVNEHAYYKRTSASLGLAVLRLFSDTPIDADVKSWLDANGFMRVYTAHNLNQTEFLATGANDAPLQSLTFAIMMCASYIPGIEIVVVSDSIFYHFPLLRLANRVYMHAQTTDNVTPTVRIDDTISAFYGAYARIYADEITGYDRSSGACVVGLASELHIGIPAYTSNATYGIRGVFSNVNQVSNITSCPGLSLLNSSMRSNSRNNRYGVVKVENSTGQMVKIYDSDEDNATLLGNFINDASGNITLKLKAQNPDNTNQYGLFTLTNTSENAGTFEGATYAAGFGMIACRLWRNQTSGGINFDIVNAANETIPLTVKEVYLA